MSAVITIVVGTAVIVLLGAAVIVLLALRQRTREQWRQTLHDTSQEVWRSGKQPAAKARYEPRQASFEEVWNRRSVSGSAYFALPQLSVNFEHHLLEAWRAKHGHEFLPQSSIPNANSSAVDHRVVETAVRAASSTPESDKMPSVKPIVEISGTEEKFSYPNDGRSIA